MNTKMKKLTIAIMLASSVTAVQAADWSDTWVSYKFQNDAREPNNNNDITKNTIGFTHASGYKYGSNYLNVDAIKSDSMDPAGNGNNSSASPGSGFEGAQEIYITYRTHFEAGKVTGKPMAFGVIKDVALTAGFDINNKNTNSAGNKRMLVLGPTFMFKLDKGFFNVSALASQETNRGASGGVGKDITYDVAPMLSLGWNLPFQAGLPAKFQGFFNVVGDKGKTYDGGNTDTEYFSRSSVMWDVGTAMGLKNNTVWAGVGYEYWKNKFGSTNPVGTDVRSLMYMAEWHF